MCRVGKASALALTLLALTFLPAQHASAQSDIAATNLRAVGGAGTEMNAAGELIVRRGQTFTLHATITNVGDAASPARMFGTLTTFGVDGTVTSDGNVTGADGEVTIAGLAGMDDTSVGADFDTRYLSLAGGGVSEFSTQEVNSAVITIEAGRSFGAYVYGVCADGETTELGTALANNNCAEEITIIVAETTPADLAATSATFAGSPPTVNEAGATVTLLTPRQSGLTLDVEVANAGAAAINAMIQVYRAPNARDAGSPPAASGCSTDNVLCTAGQPQTVGAFVSGGTTPQTSATFTASANAGLYHYFACFTDAAETATLADNCTPSIPARVGGADLSVTVAVDRNLTVSSGATTPATASITNNGADFFRFEGGLTVNFYRSGPLAGADPVPGLPTPLGSSVGMFSTGASFNVNAAGVTEPAADTLIPSTPGTYYYFACATSAALPAAICSEASPSVTVTIAGTLIFSGGATIDPQLYFTNRPSVSVTLPTATGGTAPYAYTIAPALPDGLTFVDGPAAQVLSGQPTTNQDATDYTYTATDSAGTPATVSQTFTIAVARDTNPRFANTSFPTGQPGSGGFRILEVTNRKFFSLTLPEATGGNPPLRYSSVQLNRLPGLSLDPVTRVLSGTPNFSEDRIQDYRVTDVDGDRATYAPPWTLRTRVDVTPNLPAVPDQIYVSGVAISVTLPAGSGGNGALSYSLTPALPANLTFDGRADRRTITGTAQNVTASADYTYTATDRDGSTRSRTFALRHIAVLTFGGTRTGVVPEPAIITGDATVVTAGGTVTITDNPNTAPFGGTDFAPQTDTPGIYGSFTIDADGAWLYTLANTDPDTNALAAGDTGRDIFTVSAAASVHATTEITISVAGANDAPTAAISAPPAGATTTAGEVITVTGSGADVDAGDVLTFAWTAADEDGNAAGSFADPAAASTTWTAPNAVGVQTLTLTVTDDASTPAGATATVDVTVIPVEFGGDVTGEVTEDDADNTAEGTLTVTNSGSGGTDVIAIAATDPEGMGTYGTFTIVADTRVWTYTLDNEDADTDALHGRNGGEIQTDTFTVTAAAGGTQEVVITVTGANDAPAATITSPTDGMEVEFGALITLTATGGDVDDEFFFVRWSTDPPNLGSFASPVFSTVRTAAAARTTWTVPSDSTDPVTIIMSLTDDSGRGVTSRTQVTVNPIPATVTFGGATTGALTEDAGGGDATGTLTITTASSNKNVIAQTGTPGTYGAFSVTEPGVWSYTLDNADDDTNALAEGVEMTDTFTVTASANLAFTVDVVITVTGANDPPTATISAPTDGIQVAFGSAVTLTATGEDPDTGQTATLTYEWTANPDVGSFANAAAASTTWTVPASGTDPVTLTLTATDDDATTPLTRTATVTVNPVAVAITFGGDTSGGVTEDAATTTATGTLTVSSSDPTGSTDVVADDGVGAYGAFNILANGAWTYTLLNTATATNALTAGDAEDETFTVTAAADATATVVITITVTGANDAPTVAISAPTEGMQVDFGTTVTLTATGTDPDTGQTATLTYAWTASPNVGSFADATAEDTTWTAPSSGTAAVTLTLTATDNATPPATGTAQVIVNPTAVSVTFTGSVITGAVTEDAATTAVGGALAIITSSTNKNVVPIVATAPESMGTYGTFTITAPGAWTYTLDNTATATDRLPGGTIVEDTFTVTASANPGATVDVTIRVTGANDAPTVTIDRPVPPMTGTFSVISGRQVTLEATGADVDLSANLTYTWTTNPANQGTFTSATAADTTWNPPTVTGNTNITLTLTVSDNFPSNPAMGTATFALIVTEGPSVAGDGIGTTTAATLDPITLDANGNVSDGGTATGTLTVDNIPTDGGLSTHRVTRPPMYGTVTIGGTMALQVMDQATWTYTLDNSIPEIRALGPTDDRTDNFEITTTSAGIPLVSEIEVTLDDAFPDDRPDIVFAGGPRMTVDEGEEMVTLDASGSSDPEGGTLMYLWAQNTNDDIQVTLSGTTTDTATFTAPDERTTLNFALTVTDDGTTPDPATDLTATLIVRVGRSSELALQKTLAAFGRAFATGTVSIFEDYLSTPTTSANTSHFTLGGHKFELATTTPAQTLDSRVASVRKPLTRQRALTLENDDSVVNTLSVSYPQKYKSPSVSFPNDRKTGSDSDHVFHRIGNPVEHDLANTINSANLADTTSNGATTSDDATATTTTLMSGQDLLMQSAFHLNLNDATAASPGWSFWGRATTGNFNGDTESETADAGEQISVDGSVDSGYLGIDYLTPAGTRLGLAIAQSDGEIDYDEVTGGNTTSGDLEAKLTSILPYIQWQPGASTNAWLLLGYGTGDAELATDGADEATDVDIDMQMLAFGLRGDLDRAFSRTELSWKASAFAITIESDDQPDLGGVEADSQRLRFAVEGRRPGATSAGGGAFTPGWELGMRWEDGDIERGAAADAGLRFDYTNPASGWSLSGTSTFVLFSPESYDEWTAGLQARLDPGAQGRGITFTLEPGWTKDGRSQQMGMDFSNALGKWSKRGLQLELTGERTERDDDDIGHNIRLTGSLHF